MESILIALLVAVLSSVFGGKNKAEQKKRPVRRVNVEPATKRDRYDNKTIKEKASVKPKQEVAVNYDMSYIGSESHIDEKRADNVIYEEIDDFYDEEILDIGLSDLQRAIAMAEVLGKPVALRKK